MLIRPKKTKSIDMDSKLKDYTIKNGGGANISDSLKAYFGEINQNRGVIAKMDETNNNPELVSGNMRILLTYINQMNFIRKKMTFGKDKNSCKIEFNWTDTLKNANQKSHSIEFEICNVMFNLATLYYNEGLKIASDPTVTKEIRKDATNNFKFAMYIFNWIKEEAGKIPEKERPLDLQDNYMEYCIKLCEINGQNQIYIIAKETSPKEFLLHAKILLGLSDLYRNITGIGAMIQSKKISNDYLDYYQNRTIYYQGRMFLEIKNNWKKNFDEKGKGYGEMSFYQNLALNEFSECNKSIKKTGKFIKIEDFEAEFKQVTEEKKEIDDLNSRIYHENVPEKEETKYESKILMSKALPEELYIDENEHKAKEDEKINLPDIDSLVPHEVIEMLERYKVKVNELITANLDKNENEGTISNFIQELQLRKRLTAKEGEGDEEDRPQLPQELWEKISHVQQIGCTSGLNKIMQGIIAKSNYLINSLENLLHSFQAEDNDDRACRQRFRDDWAREPSLKLNFQMVQAAQQFIKNIRQTQTFDQQARNEISNNSSYFDKLMLPLERLNQNIPEKPKKGNDALSPEEEEVKKEIQKLHEFSDKCTRIIKPIFSKLNDESEVIQQFIEVVKKKNTEQAVYEQNKAIYNAKFEELASITEEVKKQEQVISQLVQKNYDKIIIQKDEEEEKMKMDYFRHLNELTDMFMAKYEKIMKGDKYYNDLKEKIDKLIKSGNDWMIKRSDEKIELVKYLTTVHNKIRRKTNL